MKDTIHPNTLLEDSSRVEDGIEVKVFLSIEELQSFVRTSRVRILEDKKIANHIYYCEHCNTIFLLPSWYSSFYLERFGPDPRTFLEQYIECCNKPKVLFLLLPEENPSLLRDYGLAFTPYWAASKLWIVSDQWLTTRLVIKDIL